MTTIKSRSGRTELYIGRDHETKWVRMERDQDGMADSFATADLLAALDATANTDVKHRADAYEAATRAEQERDEYRLKAVAIDAERDHWKARAEKAEADHEDTKAAYRALGASHAELLTRAEKAEAALVKIIEWWDSDEEDGALGDILRPLRPKPAFTLPTTAGARVSAISSTGMYYTFELWTNGDQLLWMEEAGIFNPLTPGQLFEDFTDHRLIGAES